MNEHQNEALQPTPATHALFSDSAVRFLAAYRVWIVAAVWLAVRGYTIWGLSPNYSIESYLKLAGDWLDGYLPYADFAVEYPPGALLLFSLPRIFTEAPILYGYFFAGIMLVVDLGILLIFWRIPARVRAGAFQTDMGRRCDSAVLCLTYILFTAVFGRLLFQHYDLLVGLILVILIYFALRKKKLLVDVLLAIGIWLNLIVLIWLPLLWWYGFISREQSNGALSELKISGFLRNLLSRAAVLVGGLAVLYLPFFFLSGEPLSYILQFHMERGIQLDSTAAGLLMAGAQLFNFELATDFTHRAIHLSGELSRQGALVCGILSIVVFVILTGYLAHTMRRQRDTSATGGLRLIKGLLVTSLALLVTSKIFLPQYLLWVCPLAALLAHHQNPRISRIGWQLFAVNLISVVIFYFFYPDLIELQVMPGILLLVRVILLVWLVIALLLPDTAAAAQQEAHTHSSVRLKSKYLVYVPLVLLFVWGTTGAFRPIRNADIWMHLRVADDIVASGEIPRVDQYSAVAAGRPHLSHEWLSALIFRGVYQLGGGQALSVLRATMILAMLLLLWFSLTKRARSFILTAPLLALAAYIILERVFVRPHVFTLLFLCIWVFSLEHWRRKRRLRYLIILIPLQVLWANLHGGYIISLVIGAMLTGTAALLTLFPSLSKNESYGWSDVARLGGLTAACLAASLINPHGVQLIKFSLTTSLASDYIKQFVYEWGSPLADNYRQRAYGFDVVLTLFVLMWVGLILNIKRRPLLDAIVALLATLITFQAIRFVSFIGILGFPIMVRSWLAVADAQAKPLLLKRRPYFETALILLILASTIIYGYPYDKSTHRRIDWGFGGRLPIKTVDFLVDQDIKGIMFNDYVDGAYLLHHLSPEIRPVMDSRIDVYGSELTHEYFSCRDDPLKFFQYLNKYNVSLILLMQTEKNIPVIQLLSRLPASELLLRADDRFLFSYERELLPPQISQQLKP